jgi:hypothetical protein
MPVMFAMMEPVLDLVAMLTFALWRAGYPSEIEDIVEKRTGCCWWPSINRSAGPARWRTSVALAGGTRVYRRLVAGASIKKIVACRYEST